MISQLRHHLINLLIIALHPALAVCIGLMAFPFLMSFTNWGFWAAVACCSYWIVSQFTLIYIQIHNQK